MLVLASQAGATHRTSQIGEINDMANENEFNIIVNTRPKKIDGPNISFEGVLTLANIDSTGQDIGLFDVEWTHGNTSGVLTPGLSVALRNGMKFDAGKSNRS